uniref:Uncharacterized protein n=1 Tax=Arundo donax TaxID=35708 RepID=A0A0A8YQR3_ARUDO
MLLVARPHKHKVEQPTIGKLILDIQTNQNPHQKCIPFFLFS